MSFVAFLDMEGIFKNIINSSIEDSLRIFF